MSAPKYDTLEDALDALVSLNGECWECNQVDWSTGYGRFPFRGKKYYAHRAMWELDHGSVPIGLCVLHTCDNRMCCNPNHLFLGTDQDNSNDKIAKDRQYKPKSEDIHTAKLSLNDIVQIRKLLTEGYTHRDIAEWFGVTHTTIGNINRGKAWKDVG